LKEILDKVGLNCKVFFKKDDVPGFEYVANCWYKGRRVALGFDVDYDTELGEVNLLGVEAWRDREWTPNQLVYYTEV